MKIAQPVLYCALLLSIIFAPSALAQVADMALAAPIPSQILNAKTAFISNAGVGLSILTDYITAHTGTPNGLYNEFHADMKALGKISIG
jgi:hypothetical protein